MNTVAEHPVLVSPDSVKVTLRDSVLESFKAIEGHMKTLAACYANVAYDTSTPRGFEDAKKARLDLRDNGRYAVSRLQDRLKRAANDLKKDLESEGDRLIAITKPVEDAIDAQIKVEEDRRAAAKAEKERIERERVQRLEDRLTAMDLWIARCHVDGMTPERIEAGITALLAAEIGDDWEEFRPKAEERRTLIAGQMRSIKANLIRAIETARVAKENERLRAELAAAKAKAEPVTEPVQAARDFTKPVEIIPRILPMARVEPAQGAAAVLPVADKVAPKPVISVELEAPPPPPPIEFEEPVTMALSKLGSWLGFPLTEAFLRDSLGIQARGRVKAAVMFRDSDRLVIRDALVKHLQGLK